MLLFVDAPIIGDMKVMYESAKEIAIGNNIGTVTHLPFIIYESVIIRIFGNTLFALQLFNVLFCAGTALFYLSYCGNGFLEKNAVVLLPHFMLCIFQIYS